MNPSGFYVDPRNAVSDKDDKGAFHVYNYDTDYYKGITL